MSALVVFEDGRWLRVVDDAVVTRGDDIGLAPPPGDDERVVAVMPAREVMIHSASLPGLSEVQAQAAARTVVADASMTSIDTLHIGAGGADEAGMRTIVSAEREAVARRLASLAAYGLDPDHLLAAPLLLPRPVVGFVRGDLGSETVVRGPQTAFADDPVLTPILAERQEVTNLDRAALEQALVTALRVPEADLRQGAFAKRRSLGIEWPLIRRMARILLVAGLVVLATQIVDIVKRNSTASSIEADNRTRAAAALPPGTTVTDPAGQVTARLAAVRGAAGGYLTLASIVGAAVNASPNVELGAMVYEGASGLRVTAKGQGPCRSRGVRSAARRERIECGERPDLVQSGPALSRHHGDVEMMQQFRLFWFQRSERERQLLMVMAGLLALTIGWLGVITPINAARASAQARLDVATSDASQITAAAGALRAVRTAPPLVEPLNEIVGKASTDAGFQVSRLDPQGNGRIAVAIGTARSPALFAWLTALDRRGVIVDKLTLRANSDSTLAVDGVLRTQNQ